jgi:hypothetical protein
MAPATVIAVTTATMVVLARKSPDSTVLGKKLIFHRAPRSAVTLGATLSASAPPRNHSCSQMINAPLLAGTGPREALPASYSRKR